MFVPFSGGEGRSFALFFLSLSLSLYIYIYICIYTYIQGARARPPTPSIVSRSCPQWAGCNLIAASLLQILGIFNATSKLMLLQLSSPLRGVGMSVPSMCSSALSSVLACIRSPIRLSRPLDRPLVRCPIADFTRLSVPFAVRPSDDKRSN